MKLGKIELDPRSAGLAPMAGVADMAFRELCVEYGATYVVSEMVSSKGLTMCDRKSRKLLVLSDKERPAAAQIFGCDPKIMAQSAVSCLDFQPDVIDINMGCPAPKIAGNGGGSALLKNPKLAGEIIKEVVNAVDIPVTVKIRIGWDKDSINAVQMAKIAEQWVRRRSPYTGAQENRCMRRLLILRRSPLSKKAFRFPSLRTEISRTVFRRQK